MHADLARRSRSAQAVRHRPAGGGRRELHVPTGDRGAARPWLRQDSTRWCVAGLEHSTAGRISIAGGCIFARRQAGAVAQRHGVPPAVRPHMTVSVRQNIFPPPPRPARRDRAQDRRRWRWSGSLSSRSASVCPSAQMQRGAGAQFVHGPAAFDGRSAISMQLQLWLR